MSPLCESYVRPEKKNAMEPFYPLHVLVCRKCWLVQLDQYVSAEHIFSEYAYFSSFSDSWVQHARAYTEKMTARFGLEKIKTIGDAYMVAAGLPLPRAAVYDLVFMDVNMPGTSGLDVTRRMRERGFPTTVVAVTASAGAEEQRRCGAACVGQGRGGLATLGADARVGWVGEVEVAGVPAAIAAESLPREVTY